MPEISENLRNTLNKALSNPKDARSQELIGLAVNKGILSRDQVDLAEGGDQTIPTPGRSRQREVNIPEGVAGQIPKPAGEPEALTGPQVAIRKFGEGVTGGLANMAAAAVNSLKNQTSYTAELDKITKESKQASEESPVISGAAKIGGIMAPGGLFGRVSTASKGALASRGAAGMIGQAGANMLGASAFEISDKIDDIVSDPEILESAGNDILQNMAAAGGISVAIPVVSKVGKGLSKVIRSTRNAIVRNPQLSEESIAVYAKNPKAVGEIIKQKIGPVSERFANESNAKIKQFVSDRLNRIDDILDDANQSVDIRPLIKGAEDELLRLRSFEATPMVEKAANDLEKQIVRFASLGTKDKSGAINLNPKQLNELRKLLGKQAQRFYKDAGFDLTDPSAASFEKLRQGVNDLLSEISPEIRTLNQDLAKAINLQKTLGIGNVFKPAGEINPRKAQTLLTRLQNPTSADKLAAANELDQLVGTNLTNASALVKSAQQIGSPDLFSSSSTGRSMLMQAIGSLFGRPGQAAGAALESPIIKRAIIRGTEPIADVLATDPAAIGRGLFGAIQDRQPIDKLREFGEGKR